MFNKKLKWNFEDEITLHGPYHLNVKLELKEIASNGQKQNENLERLKTIGRPWFVFFPKKKNLKYKKLPNINKHTSSETEQAH